MRQNIFQNNNETKYFPNKLSLVAVGGTSSQLSQETHLWSNETIVTRHALCVKPFYFPILFAVS